VILLLHRFFDLLKNPFRSWFIWALLLINIVGSLYGFYWYRYQLAETPWYHLIFVPDSPLSSTFFCVVLITILIKRRSTLFELLAYLWVIKYGIWAVIINLDAGYILGEFTFENWLLSLSHLGMAIEGMIFLPHLRISKFNIILLMLWLGINDFMDYKIDLHPYLFDPSQLVLAYSIAIILSVILIIASIVLYRKESSSYRQVL
jgi:uncharacterized membrane protein YpjA